MKVLAACEMSGAVRQAFLDRGHDAWSLDLLPSLDGSTHLAVSGARWWPAKVADGRPAAAVDFVRMLSEAPAPRVAIENPVGALSRLWRRPDQIIQPWQFGHGETKATCLWLRGLPLLTPTGVVEGRVPRSWLTPGGPRQAMLRSLTYPGIARAMAEQWGSPEAVLRQVVGRTLPGVTS